MVARIALVVAVQNLTLQTSTCSLWRLTMTVCRCVSSRGEPAIYAIDLRKGVIRARVPSPRKEVPGNLLLWHGEVFAQTVTAVTAYPKRKEGAN